MRNLDPAMQAGLFLRNLFAPYQSGYMEIRAFNGQKREQSFHELPISGERLRSICLALISKSESGYDVYVGVLPRKERYGKASSITHAATVWADFDYKNMTDEEVLRATRDADMTVHSGGGMHAYWWVTQPQDVSSIRKQDAFSALVQDEQQRRSGGKADATHDLPRILRVPGTLNWKDREKPRKVCLLTCEGRNAKSEAQERRDAIDTGFTELLEDEPMHARLVEGSEEWEYYFRLACEAFAQNRIYEAAKQNRLLSFNPMLRTPGGRQVQNPNEYIVLQMERVVHGQGIITEEDAAFAAREIDFFVEYMRNNGHAY